MAADPSLANWLRLTLTAGIGGHAQRTLLGGFGGPDAIFAAERGALRELIGEKASALLLAAPRREAIDAALGWADGVDQHIVTLADAEYPQALLEIADPPTLLYVRGRLELLNRPALAIVGSRSPTPQGLENSEAFAAAFADAGLVIISGLALGVDAAAHRGALAAGGDTVAFVGTGIDRIYPARHRELALEIGEKGAIVSEFALGTPVVAANFPRRNRLISGCARGVLVVEATTESGSLISARLAAEQGREVFAIPGSIHSPQSRGCHRLIKDGAKLVETAHDVFEELRWPARRAVAAVPAGGGATADDGLLTLIGFEPCALDALAARSGLTAQALSVKLLHLELDGRVASLPGGRYQRLAKS